MNDNEMKFVRAEKLNLLAKANTLDYYWNIANIQRS